MSGLREFVSEEAERQRVAAAAAAAAQSGTPQPRSVSSATAPVQEKRDEDMPPPPAQEQCKRQSESPKAQSSGQEGRVLKKEQRGGHGAYGAAVLLPGRRPGASPRQRPGLDAGLEGAHEGADEGTQGHHWGAKQEDYAGGEDAGRDQTKRETDADIQLVEKKVHAVDNKHAKAIQSIEERLNKLELGETRSEATSSAPSRSSSEWVPLHVILGGWPPRTPRETITRAPRSG